MRQKGLRRAAKGTGFDYRRQGYGQPSRRRTDIAFGGYASVLSGIARPDARTSVTCIHLHPEVPAVFTIMVNHCGAAFRASICWPHEISHAYNCLASCISKIDVASISRKKLEKYTQAQKARA
jgi:hypothetical protein